MSYTSQTKGDRNKAKFQASNINNVFKGKSTETQQKVPHRQYGMQILGRVSNVRRMPRPSVLPSLKAETGGNDRINLVPPGGQGWGGSTESGGLLVRNSRAEALLDSPPHQSTVGGGSSAQGGRAGGSQSAMSAGAEARSWSRVTGGNGGGVGGSGGSGGSGSGGGGGGSNTVVNSSGGGHNGWASASGGNQALSTASQRDFPKLGASSAASNVSSGDTSLRPQGSLSGNWRDRGRTGVATSAPTQSAAQISPTSTTESSDVSTGGGGIGSQGAPVSGGNRPNPPGHASSMNSRVPPQMASFGSNIVGGTPRTFADTGNNARFDGTVGGTSGGAGNRVTAGKVPPPRTSVPLRTTLDDKAANTAPTGWAADQGELDFSERIVFSDEEDESPPPKPKQSDDKVIGSNANGDHSRQTLPSNQISPELHIRESISVHSHGITNNDMKMSGHRSTNQVVGQETISNKKSDQSENIGIGLSQRSVMDLMQIPSGPSSSAHHMTISHSQPQQPSFSMSGVREAWPSGPGSVTNVPMQPHYPPSTQQSQTQPQLQQPPPQQQPSPQIPQQQQQQQQQPQQQTHHHPQHQSASQYPSLMYTNSRVAPAHYGGPPPPAPHPSTIPFNSNPGPLMNASVPNASQLFVAASEDKHLSDQRNLHQKEFKTCVERARMKKRTDESDVRGVSTQSAVDDERESQRLRPRQRFDAPSVSSKGSMGDLVAVDDCESRTMPAAPREETGPPGGPPMPPVPIVPTPAPQQPTYPVHHGLQAHFGTITPGPFGPRAPWHGAHPAGATAATYPHPAAQHPTFPPHPYPPAPLPTHLLDPTIRPKNAQEYTVLVEKFQEFLRNESKRNDKNGKAEGDRTVQSIRQVNEGGPKKVVEQADPFAEEEGHDSNADKTALGSGDASSAHSNQVKVSKRESHMESSNTSQSSKRSQPQVPQDVHAQDNSRRGGDAHTTERDTHGSRSAGRHDAWEERESWSRRKSREVDPVESAFSEAVQVFPDEEDNDDYSNERKRQASRDTKQVHSNTQKRNRNPVDYSGDQQGKRTKNLRGQRNAGGGGNKPKGRGPPNVTYQSTTANFGSEEELVRPPRGGSAGQLSRSSSSLAERCEWPSDEMTTSTGDSSHRQYSYNQMPQQPARKTSDRGSRRGASSRGSANAMPRSRDYSTQQYATWGGSTGGSVRSYNSYHRNNARNYLVNQGGGNRHRYPMDHYSQSQYFEDYSYGYDYSMDEFGGQWHQTPSQDRVKQLQTQGRRESKKPSRDRVPQNRSSAPPVGANERVETTHSVSSTQPSGSQHQQEQQRYSQSKQQSQSQGNDGSKMKREQQNRNREQASKSATGSGSKGRVGNKKQGSTESNTSSNISDHAIASTNTASNVNKVPSEVKTETEKLKEVEEKPVVQLQPAPVPTVNVWNTKHPLIANAQGPGGPAPSNQNNDSPPVPIDLMTAAIPINSDLRVQPVLQNTTDHSGPKPLIPTNNELSVVDDANGVSETSANGGSEARRGRDTNKARKDRNITRDRQVRGERRGSSRRSGGVSGSGTTSGGAVSNTAQHTTPLVPSENHETKRREPYSQSHQNEDTQQRGRRRRQNKDNPMENTEEQLVYGDVDYAEYESYMNRSYGARFVQRPLRGPRGYRGYHYRGYGTSRNFFPNYYPSTRSYYASNQRYYGSQPRYRGSGVGGARIGSSSSNCDPDGHGTGVYGSNSGKRQGSVSKETVTSDGNEQEDWETASESSDVANRDTRRRPPSGGSGGGGAAGGGGSGGSNVISGGSGSSSSNNVGHQQQHQQNQQRQRGRQHKVTSSALASVLDEKVYDDDSEPGSVQQIQRKRNRMEGIDLNNFASVIAVDTLPEVTVDEEFLYDNAAEFVEVLSKNAKKTKKREEMKQKQEQLLTQNPRGRQTARRNVNSGEGLTKRRTNGAPSSSGSGSGSGSPPKRLQSSKMTADERRRHKKVVTSIVKPSGMVKPLLSSLSDQVVGTKPVTSGTPAHYNVSTNLNCGGSSRSNKAKLPPRLAKQQQQQQQQQQHCGTTTAPPLMSLDSAELEQSVMAADLSAGRKCASVSSTKVTDFKIESWDNSLAEDIPKVRRSVDQQSHLKQKVQVGRTDSPKPPVMAPIAPPNASANGVTNTGKADSGVETGGEVSDRSSHSSGGAAASEKRTHSPQTKSEVVNGQAINLLDASVVSSSLQTGDTLVDSSNEEYKLPDGFVLSCQRVTGDFDEIKASAGTSNSGTSERVQSNSSKINEITVPARDTDSSKTPEVGSCTRNDPVVTVASSVSAGTTEESMPLSAASVTVTTGSSQSSTVEEGTSTLNKKIALVKSCWPEANDKTCQPSADGEAGSLLASKPGSSSKSVNETETAVSSSVVISNVCKVKPQQKMTDSNSNVSASAASSVVDEVSSSTVSATASNIPDVHEAQTMSVFPETSHLSSLPASAPSFVPKTTMFHQSNHQDSVLASGNAGVMYASTGSFPHVGTSSQPRTGYGPPGAAGTFTGPPSNVARSNMSYSTSSSAKCPPVSLSIPAIAQQNVKAIGLGIGFGMGGNAGDPSLLGHGPGTSNNAAVAALLQRQNSNSVGVIGPPTGPNTPQCSTYQAYNIQSGVMSNAAAGPSAATPTGGSWPSYGPNLGFNPGLSNPAPGTQQAAAWTYLKNQNHPGSTGPTAPGLPSPNTPSPAPSRQPFIFNLWPIPGGTQTQQPGGSGAQPGLGTTGNHLFGTGAGTTGTKFAGNNPNHSSQLGSVPPNLHNLVSLPQFRGGMMDTNTNCNVQSSLYDTNAFPHQHQPSHHQQQQQSAFTPFTDFPFSQTQLPIKPHGNPTVATAPSPQMDLLAFLTNEFNANRGADSKTPTLNPLCMAPFSQPTQPHQPPQHSTTVSRHTVAGLNSTIGVPHSNMMGKQNALDVSSAGINAKPHHSGWGGPTGLLSTSSTSHIPPNIGQNVHHPRSHSGSVIPPRSSPTAAGICGSTAPSNSQSTNNRRMFGNSSFSYNGPTGVPSGSANQSYSGYRSHGGSSSGGRGMSVGYGGYRGSRGARGGGQTGRGTVYGGSYRNHRGSNTTSVRSNSARGSNFVTRGGGANHSDMSARRIPGPQNSTNESESDLRTVDKPTISDASATTPVTNIPSHSSNDTSTGSVEKLSVTLSGCGDHPVNESLDPKPNDSSGDIELDNTTRSAISLSPCPSDVLKSGQVDKNLLLDGHSEKLESMTHPSSVIQNNESSAALSVTSTSVVDF